MGYPVHCYKCGMLIAILSVEHPEPCRHNTCPLSKGVPNEDQDEDLAIRNHPSVIGFSPHVPSNRVSAAKD